VISIFESVVTNQPPNLQNNNVTTTNQQAATPPVANSATVQQSTPQVAPTQPNSSTPKDYLKTAAKIGLGIGGLSLAHALYHGNLPMPGFANIGGAFFNSNNEPTPTSGGSTASSNSELTPTSGGSTSNSNNEPPINQEPQVTSSNTNQKTTQRNTEPIGTPRNVPMVGPLSSPTMPGTSYNTNTFYTKHSQNNESRIRTGHMYDPLTYRSGYYRYNPAHNSMGRW